MASPTYIPGAQIEDSTIQRIDLDVNDVNGLYPSLTASRAQNTVFAGPIYADGAPTFRALTTYDLPGYSIQLSASWASSSLSSSYLSGSNLFVTSASIGTATIVADAGGSLTANLGRNQTAASWFGGNYSLMQFIDSTSGQPAAAIGFDPVSNGSTAGQFLIAGKATEVNGNVCGFHVANLNIGSGDNRMFVLRIKDASGGHSTGSVCLFENRFSTAAPDYADGAIYSNFLSSDYLGNTAIGHLGQFVDMVGTTHYATAKVTIYGGPSGTYPVFQVFQNSQSLTTSSIMVASSGKVGVGVSSTSTFVPINTLDVGGNISCSVITASLFNGTASYATIALTASFAISSSYNIVNVTQSIAHASQSNYATNSLSQSISTVANNANYYVDLSAGSSGYQPTYVGTGLTFNPSTNLLNVGGNILLTGYLINATNAPASSNFVGVNAGFASTNAGFSNFFGADAGASAVNANYSNIFGASAGLAATNANTSNFFGPDAGYNAPNANNSLFIGYQAGYNDTVNNSSGPNSSILIGDYTSTGGNSDSIAIGKGTQNSINNQLNVGNVLYASNIYSGSTPTSTPQSNGRVGIGTTSPVNTLDVVGNISCSVITASIVTGTNIYASAAYSNVYLLTGSYNPVFTASWTLTNNENGKFLVCSSSNGMNMTVPSGLNQGFACTFYQSASGQVSVVTGSGVTAHNRLGLSSSYAQYSIISLIQAASNNYVIQGDCG